MSGKNPIPTRDGQIYEGVNVLVPLGGWQFVRAKRDPLPQDKKYPFGTLWLNTVSLAMWYNAGSGIWEAFGGGAVINALTTPTLMTPSTSYIANTAALETFTLPLIAQVGQIIQVTGNGAGGWIIDQNAGQTIHFNATSTTTGTGGSLASTNRYNSVTLMNTVANTDWVVVTSSGTLTVT